MTAVLDRPVLVLNRLWQPVGVMAVHKAMVKTWNESARIIDPEDFQLYTWEDWAELRPTEGDPVIRTKSFDVKVPEVIVLRNYDKLPSNAVTFSRRNIFKRDKYCCQYCSRQLKSEDLTIDHVVPKSRNGGVSSWSNCVLACVECNFTKANRTPEEAGMRLRKKPVKPEWSIKFSSATKIPSWEKFVSELYWTVELEE